MHGINTFNITIYSISKQIQFWHTFFAINQSLKCFNLQSHFHGLECRGTFFKDSNGTKTSGARVVSWLLFSMILSTDSPMFLKAVLSIRRIRQLETSILLRLLSGGNWYLDKLKLESHKIIIWVFTINFNVRKLCYDIFRLRNWNIPAYWIICKLDRLKIIISSKRLWP